jgi:hypothetical protein
MWNKYLNKKHRTSPLFENNTESLSKNNQYLMEIDIRL